MFVNVSQEFVHVLLNATINQICYNGFRTDVSIIPKESVEVKRAAAIRFYTSEVIIYWTKSPVLCRCPDKLVKERLHVDVKPLHSRNRILVQQFALGPIPVEDMAIQTLLEGLEEPTASKLATHSDTDGRRHVVRVYSKPNRRRPVLNHEAFNLLARLMLLFAREGLLLAENRYLFQQPFYVRILNFLVCAELLASLLKLLFCYRFADVLDVAER